MSSKEFVELIESAGYEAQSYSGRFMYGKRCVGVVADVTGAQLAADVMRAAVADQYDLDVACTVSRELCFIFRDTKQDSMGLDSVYYWPRLEWVEPE